MFKSQDIANIGIIYERLLNESPDSIKVGEKEYSYDNRNITAYSGMFSPDGAYYVYGNPKEVVGHYELSSVIRSGIYSVLTHTFPSDDVLNQTRGYMDDKFRIWSDFDVLSMWGDYNPKFNNVIIEVIKSIGKNPETYVFEFKDHSLWDDTEMSYDELMSHQVTDETEQAHSQANAERGRDARKLGDYMAKPKLEPEYGVKAPSFYNRQGD